jgi:hypothetical protein
MAPILMGFFISSFPTVGWAEEKTTAPAETAASEKPAAKAEAKPPAQAPSAAGAGTYVEDFLEYRLDIQSRVEGIWADYLAQYGKQLKWRLAHRIVARRPGRGLGYSAGDFACERHQVEGHSRAQDRDIHRQL